MKDFKIVFVSLILTISCLFSCNPKAEVPLTSISATTHFKVFNIGDTIIQDNVVLTATYSDETTKIIESKDYTISDFVDGKYTVQPEDVPERTFTCKYLDKTCEFTIGVDTVDKITATPAKTTYNVNDTMNQDEVTLTATYTSGSTKVIESKDYTIAGFVDNKYTFKKEDTGSKTFICEYNNRTCQFSVTVKDETYTVSFNTNGGTPEIPSQTIISSNPYAVRPSDPTKENYIFVNWYTDESLTTVYDFTQVVTKNMTLYAGWGHKVTFSNEGIEGAPEPQIVLDNHFAKHPGLPKAKETGKACYGWSLKDDEYFIFSSTPITSDVILKALISNTEILEIKGQRNIESSDEIISYSVEGISASELTWEVINGSDLLTSDGEGIFRLTEKAQKQGGLATIKASYKTSGEPLFGIIDVSIGTFECLDTKQLEQGIVTVDPSKASKVPANLVMPRCYYYQAIDKNNSWCNAQLESIAKEAFYEKCLKVGYLYIPSTINNIEKSAFSTNVFSPEMLKEIVFDEKKGAQLVIGNYSFLANNSQILKLPSRLSKFDNASFAYSFSLQEVDLENADVAYIPPICFYCNVKLKTLKLPKKVELLDCASFSFCYCLHEISIPQSCAILRDCFTYSPNIKHIIFEKESTWDIFDSKKKRIDVFSGKEIKSDQTKYLDYLIKKDTLWAFVK